MKISEALYNYFSEQVDQIAKEWIETMEDSDPNSIYSLTNPVITEELTEQDKEFYQHINKMYIMPKKEFLEEFERWVIELAKDQKHLDTPVQYVVREFMRNRRLYVSYYDAFADKHESSFAQGERKKWENLIVQVFDFTIYTFVDHAEHNSKMQLNAQREMILELSSPVITLSKRTALLPLVGDIDTERAKFILENTLSTCAKRLIEHLLIDLSGVVVVDTMVAHQIFKLVEALKLIGVTSTLSGIRPEIAQTAVQLGINFSDITIKSNLAQALNYHQ
ncbi:MULTISPECIES: STAS domain-containing protein [Bacillus amyloliquefaciens group]|uniref:STAS domain-containing protein n=1 Tax=Bacillus amyloliquefaciens group TaxID=1938374 RepID=UPI0010A4316B|nr:MULTISPECIES: STAS domain-containing protein [Bacillus amyloliquefaciens group]MBO3650036.1 STAS domain-containing protein [Bacillus amyloliquefaciens]MCJ2174644.1 STAS domain-containing protein [Bacillus amyloliquefaciens]MCR4348326.1 STAS domain-containing protein [Bacillus amyloliquefaciens]MCR4356967.1 STAS domain-containing protein [Bacillus amyloliquefaciens]MEC1511035.1 STAS domain-containing protein [Bacillus velezensis]